MKISTEGIKLIKSFEGCSLKAYKCPAGVWTIGWGTTEPVKGKKPCEGMVITQAQADQLLIDHLKTYEDAVNKLGVSLNQNQYDALVSFCYNLGTGIFKGSLLTAIKCGNWSNVASQMLLYNKARVNGVLTELKGLTRRRQAESELFLKSVKATQDDPELSNAVSKTIKKGVDIDFNKWKRKDLFKLADVPFLVCKLASIDVNGAVSKEQYKQAIDKLVSKECISQRLIWDERRYTENNVRSLLIKFSKLG